MNNLIFKILAGLFVFMVSTTVIGFLFVNATDGPDGLTGQKGGRIVASFLAGLIVYYVFVPFIGSVAFDLHPKR